MSGTEETEVIDLTISLYSSPPNLCSGRRSSYCPEITEVIDLVDESLCDETNSVIILNNDTTNPRSVRGKKDKSKKKEEKIHKTQKINDNNKKESISKKSATCSICWDELGKKQIASTKCGHVYCLPCLEQSLSVNKKCPSCRRSLKGNHAYHPLYLELS